jgi:hypothetical protein
VLIVIIAAGMKAAAPVVNLILPALLAVTVSPVPVLLDEAWEGHKDRATALLALIGGRRSSRAQFPWPIVGESAGLRTVCRA